MKFMKHVINGDVQSVRDAFLPYVEGKSSIGWLPLVGDNSSRIGLHAFVSPKRITGYYETGERTRTGGLILGKTRFYLFLKSKKKGTQVRGIIMPDPVVMMMGVSALGAVVVPLFQNFSLETVFYFLLTYCLELLIYYGISKSEPKLYEEIEHILKGI